MYSKEEGKQIRQDFWTFFGKRYHRKWILYDTKIKDLVLKFTFEDRRALVSIDINHDDPIFKEYYWEKFQSLKSIMLDEISPDLVFDHDYILELGKEIPRIYVYMEGVKINKKTDWPQVFEFFHDTMDKFEMFYWEYKDIIE